MVDHALSHLRPEDVHRRAPLVDLREKAVKARATAEKEQISQVARTSYLLGKLPVETLVEIFTVLINEDHTWAVKLSHVCGHWRQILVNTPSAWQTLVLSNKHPLRKAKLWKQRAKNRIAYVSVDVSVLDRVSICSELRDLSWDDLSNLRIPAQEFTELHRMLSDISLPHAFSKLDELTLVKCSADDQPPFYPSGPNWKLRVLRLNGAVDMLDEWWQRIQQLRELHIAGPLVRFSMLVFEANPLLEILVLDCQNIFYTNLNPDNNTSPTPMNNLKIIKCQGVRYPIHILRAVSAPSITHFSLLSAIATDETLLHIASRPSLAELYIASCSISPSTLPTLLSSTSNLETLKLNSIQAVVNEMLEFLTPRIVNSLHGLPCRALKHVDVSHCSDLTTSSAYAFIKTRTQYASESVESAEKCAVVVSLKVDGCPNIEPDMLPWFRSKVAQFSCVYTTKKELMKNRRRVL